MPRLYSYTTSNSAHCSISSQYSSSNSWSSTDPLS